MYNLTARAAQLPDVFVIRGAVMYYVEQATAMAIGRSPMGGGGRGGHSRGGGRAAAGGTLHAVACATSAELWRAALPEGDSGYGSAPWQKILVIEAGGGAAGGEAAEALDDALGAATVLVGGHHQGACFRGHCQPSHSALAAIRAPANIHPPPIPPPPPPIPTPAPPSRCHAAMKAACSADRARSVDKCEVCCGMHASPLQRAGCAEPDFELFCHTASCNPAAHPPEVCPLSGRTCPRCGEPRCDCPPPTPTTATTRLQ